MGKFRICFSCCSFFFGTLEFLRNVFQDAWKNLTSLRIFILPDKFRADYIGWFIFIFAQNFQNSTNPDAWKDSAEIFSTKLWKNSRRFQKFHPVQEIIKVESFSILPKNLGTLEKSWRLKISGIWKKIMLQIVLRPVHRLKKVWISTQAFWAHWKNPNTWKKWGSFWDFFLPDNL